jgi:hypothetical protein
MSHRKNFQVIKHDDSSIHNGGKPVGKPTTARQARTAADAARQTRETGSATWYGVQKTRRTSR